jgi:hypothetical protein
VQQRAIIRLNEELVKLAQQEDYAIYCDDENFKKQAGKRPSPLQYFIASIGFLHVQPIEAFCRDSRGDHRRSRNGSAHDLRLDPIKNFSDAAQGISYLFKIKSTAPIENIIKIAQSADRGCHTVNSMRKRIPVAGKLILNDREYEIRD